METTVSLKCDVCKHEFSRTLSRHNRTLKRGQKEVFCSQKCFHSSKKRNIKMSCAQCGLIICKKPKDVKKAKEDRLFCSKSCSTTYNNTHKQHGTRRSKLEDYIDNKLIDMFPDIPFVFNDKITINSELDIYIPSLKLAFELNGIFHYEPIFGNEKLSSIKNNDERKMQACIENGIELCIIDSSDLKYFKPAKADKYLNIITSIIRQKLSQE